MPDTQTRPLKSNECPLVKYGPSLIQCVLRHVNDVVAHGIEHQTAHGVQLKFPHDVGAMSLRGLDAQAQRHRHFLGAASFRQQLHYFALSRSQLLPLPCKWRAARGPPEITL